MTAMPMSDLDASKEAVRAFWDKASCGEIYADGMTGAPRRWKRLRRGERYRLEPYLRDLRSLRRRA